MNVSPDSHPPAALLDRLAAVVGPRHVLVSPHDTAPHLTESRGLYAGRALAVVRPGTTEEVAAVVRLCHETGTAIVPQGGNTGLVGGQIPDDTGAPDRAVARALDRIREVDRRSDDHDRARPASSLQRAQEAAAEAGRLFPLSLAARGHLPTIGGNLSTNAGGTAGAAYGNARDLVLGPRGGAGRRPRSGTACASCARTIPATTCATCSSAPRARSASSPPRC